jgi:hypothetical protein
VSGIVCESVKMARHSHLITPSISRYEEETWVLCQGPRTSRKLMESVGCAVDVADHPVCFPR